MASAHRRGRVGREVVKFEGGPIDGAEGDIAPECSRLGFCIYEASMFENEDGFVIYGYRASGRVTNTGLRIFAVMGKTRGEVVNESEGHG